METCALSTHGVTIDGIVDCERCYNTHLKATNRSTAPNRAKLALLLKLLSPLDAFIVLAEPTAAFSEHFSQSLIVARLLLVIVTLQCWTVNKWVGSDSPDQLLLRGR